ncbi:hypothetical protein SDC9_175041 [bioreactor metagenome]|uniref:Uncharacterized protein n=1 Tax=bioreactor metagenome TaxID=1076179 RepID=A0A645GL40_9ZZZZ
MVLLRLFAADDAVRGAHDLALRCLAKNFSQPHNGHYAGINNITQYIARAHAGQLVHIAHQHNAALRAQRPQQTFKQ